MIPEACICGASTFSSIERYGLSLRQCVICDVISQPISMTPQEHIKYYQNDYGEIYTHTYAHDCEVAVKRLKAYALETMAKILDVGCGSGAFVHTARLAGHECDGVDLCVSDTTDLYQGQLPDIYFPTDDYDVVTLHDVLEHVLDPVALLKEIRRVLKPQGQLIIDFPNYFASEGKHHWKPVEHLWFPTSEQLESLVKKCGFNVHKVYSPIPSKVVLVAFAEEEPKRTTILIPPGIGDSYWVMAKLESFLEVNGFDMPDVFVSSTRVDRNRAHDYIKKHPFLNAMGYCKNSIKRNPIWKEAYLQDGRSEFRDVLGCDFFLSANGPFRFGKTLEEILPQYETNWYPDMFISRRERAYGEELRKKYGPYVMAFFTDGGTYKAWLRELPGTELYKALTYIHDNTGCRIILTGADWDLNNVNSEIMQQDAGHDRVVNLIGQTSLEEFFGLLRASDGCIGFCGGNTIMSTVFKKPTVIIWNRFYDKRFFVNSCPPDSLGNWYLPADTSEVDGQELAGMLTGLMEQNS